MSSRPGLTIMIHRDGAVESRTIRLPLWLARALGGLGIGAALVLIGAAALYAPLARTAARVPGLTRELEALRAENAQVRELAAALARVESRYQQVRTMLGGDVTPRPEGTAGDFPEAPPLLARAPVEGARRYVPGLTRPRYWPLDGRWVITRGTVEAGAGVESHRGLDIAAPRGTPIRAAGGGVVARAGADPEYGLFVLLQHPDGFESMYGHASRLLVAPGDTVSAGQVIGLTGSTGRSTAPHLHFEIRRAGEVIDPRTVITEGES